MNFKISFLIEKIQSYSPVFAPSLWQIFTIVFVGSLLGAYATTLFLHRARVHRALTLNKTVEHLCKFVLWLNTGANFLYWIAGHGYHHGTSDTERDITSPHNPIKLFGRRIVFTGPMTSFVRYFTLYRKPLRGTAVTLRERAKKEDLFSQFVYLKFSWLGPIVLLGFYFFFFGMLGICMVLIQFMYLPIMAGGIINGLGHSSEEKDLKTKDYSQNVLESLYRKAPIFGSIVIGVLSFLSAGEIWHHMHHLHPRSAKITPTKWQVDFGWFVVYFLRKLKLASDVRYFSFKEDKIVNL